MNREILVDTGPIVSFLNGRDADHAWVASCWQQLRPPLLTNEPVLAEAASLVHTHGGDADAVLQLLERDVLRIDFRLGEHLASVRKLMRKYHTAPMSLADACLVRMTELRADCAVFTLDDHFRIYRRHGRQVIPVLKPA